MIERLKKYLTIAAIISVSSCATIHFENGEVVPDPEPFSWTFGFFDDEQLSANDASLSIRHRKWYHLGIYQIAELSNPLETSQVCLGLDWNQITTEVTPFDAVIGLLDNALLLNASSAGLDLWSPWSIEYSCREQR